MDKNDIDKMMDLLGSIESHASGMPDMLSSIHAEIQEANKRLDDFMNLVEARFDRLEVEQSRPSLQ